MNMNITWNEYLIVLTWLLIS